MTGLEAANENVQVLETELAEKKAEVAHLMKGFAKANGRNA